jgi:hypothetical protein
MKKVMMNIFIILILATYVNAAKLTDQYNKLTAEFPSTIDVVKPFEVKLTISDKDVMKYGRVIDIGESSCYFDFIDNTITDNLLIEKGYTNRNKQMEYHGEKEIVVKLIGSRQQNLYDVTGAGSYCVFTIRHVPTDSEIKQGVKDSLGYEITSGQRLTELYVHMNQSVDKQEFYLPEGILMDSFSLPTQIFARSQSSMYAIILQRYSYLLEDGKGGYMGSKYRFDVDNVNYAEHFDETTKIAEFSGELYDIASSKEKLELKEVMPGVMPKAAYYRSGSKIFDDMRILRDASNVQISVFLHAQIFFDRSFTNFKLSTIKVVSKEKADSEIASIKADMLKTVTSYKIKAEGLENLKFTAENKKDEAIKDPIIYGTIADADNNPMPYMRLEVLANNKRFQGATSESGDFKIELTGLEIGDKPLKADMAAFFDYVRDGKNFFAIKFIDVTTGSYKNVFVGKSFNLTEQNNEVHLVFDDTADSSIFTSKTVRRYDQIKSLSVMYYHFHESVDFALTKLNANIDYKLPVEVWVGNNNSKTLYSPDNSEILISMSDSTYSSSNRPKNREYHEFAHHIMYSEYGSWPAGRLNADVKNHDGFLNPNTGDSYLEGFAEFMALAISKENGDKTPEIYASFGSMENNYKPWDSKGYAEELAVASLLWDLYDSKNERGDSVTLSLEDIWKVIKVNRKDFYEYYSAFKQQYPNQNIDELFISHGFFADTDLGNKKRDSFEGFKDGNSNKAYDIGEFFADYSADSIALLKYTKGMIIGRAANYDRINRTSAVRLDNAYIRVANPEVRWYIVKVDYSDSSLEDYSYAVDVRDGLIYVQPLPSGYDARITITPESQDYTAEQPYSVSATELTEKVFSADKGYFAEHDFKLKPTGKKLDVKYYLADEQEPTYAYEGDLGDKQGVQLVSDKSSISAITPSKSSALVIVIIFTVIVVGISLFYFRRRKKHIF